MANEPLDLAALVARLRSAGLKTDIRQYLAAHELILALAGQGKSLQEDSEALASHLGPIFCGSPEEQQLFRQEFMEWRGEPRAAAAPATPPVKRKNRRGAWVLAVCASIALAGTAGILWLVPPVKQEAPPPPPPDPVDAAPEAPETSAIKSSFVVSAPTKVSAGDVPVESKQEVAVPWPTIIAGGLGAALLTFLLLWLRQKARRDHCLSRMAPDPNTKRIELNLPPPAITKIRTIALRRISAGLRRTRANEVFDLSVTATVNATANAGGFVVPVFSPRVAIPEYLVLIDRRSESDHSAQLVYGWVTQLCGQGVAADCFEFDSDPRVCREFGTQRSHRLPALLARHHRATVLLFAESDVCIDPITNRPQEWMRWFNSLPNRVLLTLAPPYRWAANEQRLSECGFVVVPASPSGLQIAAAMDRNSLEAIGTGAKYAREFPRLIAQDALRWLDRNPPPEATVTRLVRALHEFLGPDGYSWLCACAIYPQISWPITLTLLDTLLPPGSDLPARRAIDEQLPSISRLPWFRYGYMPDWLRKLLIAQLEPEKEAGMRAALEKLVCGLLDSPEASDPGKREADSSRLGIRIRPKAFEVARAAPANSPLQDEVFLDFLAGATPDPLSLRLSSLPHIDTPRRRNLATRIRERWRATRLRRPLLWRTAVSSLVALLVGAILWVDPRRELTPVSTPVPDSDVNYYLASSDLSGSETIVAVSPNGQYLLLASSKAGKYVEVWDLPGRKMQARIPTVAQPFVLAFNPESDRIGIFDEYSNVYLSTLAGDTEQMTVDSPSPAAARIRDLGDTLRFNSDSSLLMHYNRESMTVFDLKSRRLLATRSSRVGGASFFPGDPNSILAYLDRYASVVNARTLESTTAMWLPPSDQVEFSLDRRNLAQLDPIAQSYLADMEFRDASTGILRAKVTPPTGSSPTGWVWSGDGNLVAYEETRGRTAIYDLSHGQLVTSGESRLPATNRLYTIRFVRSDQRLPDSTYYEISERSIDLAPASDPAPPPVDPTPLDQPQRPAPEQDAETAKTNKEILATLDPDVRRLATRLIGLAARQEISVLLLEGGRARGDGTQHPQRPDAVAAHRAGRAFDFAVRSDSGGFVVNDLDRMNAVGKIGKGIGLTWGGDIDVNWLSHFELPAKPEAANVEKENEGVLSTLDRETSARARQLLDMARKEGMTLSLRSVRQPSRVALRHRSDISEKLDAAGRGFNVAVLTPDGTWSTNDFSMFTQVAKLAQSLGFDWSGDWGYGQYFHFDLPESPAQTTSGAESPPQTNQSPQQTAPASQATQAASRPSQSPNANGSLLRLARTEFEFPRDKDLDGARRAVAVMSTAADYSGIIQTPEGASVGAFAIRLEKKVSGKYPVVGKIELMVQAIGNPENLRPPGQMPDNLDLVTADAAITTEEYQAGTLSRTVDPGVLRVTMTLDDAALAGSGNSATFDTSAMRIRVTAQSQPGEYERSRTPARKN